MGSKVFRVSIDFILRKVHVVKGVEEAAQRRLSMSWLQVEKKSQTSFLGKRNERCGLNRWRISSNWVSIKNHRKKKNIKHRAVLSSILELILWVDDLFHSEKQNWEQMDKRQQKKQPN